MRRTATALGARDDLDMSVADFNVEEQRPGMIASTSLLRNSQRSDSSCVQHVLREVWAKVQVPAQALQWTDAIDNSTSK